MIEAPVLQFQYTSLTGRSGDVGVAPGFLQGTLHMNKKQHRLFMHIPPNISDLWQFHSHLLKSNVDCIAFNINLLFYPLSLHYTHQEEWIPWWRAIRRDSARFRIKLPGFGSCLCYLLLVKPWARRLASLSLQFCIYKMEMMIIIANIRNI